MVSIGQDWFQFGEVRAEPQARFGGFDSQSIAIPQLVRPFQGQNFAGGTHPRKPGESEDHPPVVIRAGFQHGGRGSPVNEVMPFCVALRIDLDRCEGAGVEQPPTDGIVKQQSGALDVLGHGCFGHRLDRVFVFVATDCIGQQPAAPLVGIGRGDGLQRPVGSEMFDKKPLGLSVGFGRSRGDVRTLLDVAIDERAQQPIRVRVSGLAIVDKPVFRQVGPQPSGNVFRPRFGEGIWPEASRLSSEQFRYVYENGISDPLADIAQPEGTLLAGVITPANFKAGPIALLLMQ